MTDDIKQPKRPRDANQLAKSIVDIATGEMSEEESATTMRARKGGKVGGIARANALSAEERADIARTAALARWKKSD